MSSPTVITGALSDHFSAIHGPAGLRYALIIVMALTVPTAYFFYRASSKVAEDLED